MCDTSQRANIEQMPIDGQKTLMGLNEDSWREVCDRMDLRTLCKFSRAYPEVPALGTIARQSFKARKVTMQFYFRSGPANWDDYNRTSPEHNEFRTFSSRLCKRMLREFGDLFIGMDLKIHDTTVSKKICAEVARYCGGTLKVLKFQSAPMFNATCANVKRLTAGVTELEATNIGFLQYPNVRERIVGQFWELSYPHLERLRADAALVTAEFLSRHQHLTDVGILEHVNGVALMGSIVQMHNLKKLEVNWREAEDQQFANLPPLKSLKVLTEINGAVLRRNAALVASLEEMDFEVHDYTNFLDNLASFPSIRVVRYQIENLYDQYPELELPEKAILDAIKKFVAESVSPQLERFELRLPEDDIEESDLKAVQIWCRAVRKVNFIYSFLY